MQQCIESGRASPVVLKDDHSRSISRAIRDRSQVTHVRRIVRMRRRQLQRVRLSRTASTTGGESTPCASDAATLVPNNTSCYGWRTGAGGAT